VSLSYYKITFLWQDISFGKSILLTFLTGERGYANFANISSCEVRKIRMTKFSHIDTKGKAQMVDVTAKERSVRKAVARGKVLMKKKTLSLIERGEIPKGDVFTVARIAGIMAAKKTGEMIPMCHPLELTGIDIQFTKNAGLGEITIEATVRTVGRTGVEMEAMTAVSVAALTIYDMCKSADKYIVLSDIKLITKHGGKSGLFIRDT
jgi:cyclic pyranopterin phosphate synthase